MAPCCGLSYPLRELQWPKGLGSVAYGGLAFGGAIAVRWSELGRSWLRRV